MDERKKKHFEILLADYSAIKSEIARRSNLQRIVLGSYVAAIAFIFKQVVDYSKSSLWPAVLWWAVALALQFYMREDLEIKRLDSLISGKIAMLASKKIDVPVDQIFHSGTKAANQKYDSFTGPYDRQFNWIR